VANSTYYASISLSPMIPGKLCARLASGLVAIAGATCTIIGPSYIDENNKKRNEQEYADIDTYYSLKDKKR
jgi:hypothetical protein